MKIGPLRPVMSDAMDDHTVNGSGQPEPAFADLDTATRRLMAALDALERAVERRREADRDEDELAARIQALGADRARLADELDGSLVRSKRLERSNREIAERLDAAIGTIREVLEAGELSRATSTSPSTAGNIAWPAKRGRSCGC
jgi:chromosome segregation ATPase